MARGDQARKQIMAEAISIGSVEGLESLSIGRLATALRVSKSGVFAHFGSKEELQLAAVRAAAAVFAEQVSAPAMATAPGMARVRALCEARISHAERRVFPGGCFFFSVGAEFDSRPGRVRDAIAAVWREWLRLHAETIEEARQLGEISSDIETKQLVFELDAFITAANLQSTLQDDAGAWERARVGIRERLAAASQK